MTTEEALRADPTGNSDELPRSPTYPKGAVTCPQSIRAANRKAEHRLWWDDPLYQAIVAKRIEGETCVYCKTRPATTAHHNYGWCYTKEEYYKPENMQPICESCHKQYRRGLEVCPVCLSLGEYHFMIRGSEKCSRHRNTPGAFIRTGIVRRRSVHPCRFNDKSQHCMIKVVCPYTPKKADECPKFKERVRL
jgi:hypothetical protein